MQPNPPLKIFIIYAHEDRSFKEDLLKRLKLLRTQGLIQPWHDRDLLAGDDWDTIIRGHLANADIILPIISIDFFNSDYIEQVEIVEAFERYEKGKAHIIPIIARSCRWGDDARIGKLQALPENGLPIAKWDSADDAFDSVYDGIKAKIGEIQLGRQVKTGGSLGGGPELVPSEKKAEAEQPALELPPDIGPSSIRWVDPFANLMVQVKGGTFDMGETFENGFGNVKPIHKVTLSDFKLCKYPVTQGQWKAIMPENPSGFKGDDRLPIEKVNWDDAQVFIQKLNEKTGKTYRLPTEAEWEYAAKGGNASKRNQYAGSNDLKEVAWFLLNAGSKTHPVGEKKANELGIYDMSGNVWEWCQDWFGGYASEAQMNPKGPDKGTSRILRGGSWIAISQGCSSTFRYNKVPDARSYFIGFRLALQ